MKRRFTGRSRIGRGSIPKTIRNEIYSRDGHKCQFCLRSLDLAELTIDHLVPLALGGLDEITNYVTCCRSCNNLKADKPLVEFAQLVNLEVKDLPVHGDPVIDNVRLPKEIRVIRKRIFDRMRSGKLNAKGRSAQKKIEREYRREFWTTSLGQELQAKEPSLPSQVRIAIPEIRTVAKTPREYLLLVELAKSASTRELIGKVLCADVDVEGRVRSMASTGKDVTVTKRLNYAIRRFERVIASRVDLQ